MGNNEHLHNLVHLGYYQGLWEEWTLSDAGDGKYFVASHDGQYLSDYHGYVHLTSNQGHSEEWTISDAGFGLAFIRSHRGSFLQDSHGLLGMSPNPDNFEKWSVHDLDSNPGCKFETANLFCFVVMRSWGDDLDLMRSQH